jgi:NAD(P)-dependent dehydrogenase (short-subunit alcohol dehydrogenase family)
VNDFRAPGFFLTEMTKEDLSATEALMDRILMGRVGDPAELAAAVQFVAFNAASDITAQTLIIDGAFTAT